MEDYVDVRGPVPIYFRGKESLRLVGKNRNVTIEEAREIFKRWKEEIENEKSS